MIVIIRLERGIPSKCESSARAGPVDPAGSHSLVSKIYPCMSKFKSIFNLKLRTAH